MKTTTFKISGMHCVSCVTRNEQALKKVLGVKNASVNFATQSATVEFDETKATEHHLHKAIEKNGYKVLKGVPEHRHEAGKQEMAKARKKAILAIVLALPAVILAMFGVEFPLMAAGYNLSIWFQAGLSFFVILILGWEFHVGLIKQARHGTADMNTLISLGTLSALGYSLWALISKEMHLYFETGAVITALILLGRYFEAKSHGQASEAIEKLIKLGAKTARLLENGQEREVPVEKVRINDILLVKPGEKIPVDGLIVNGFTTIDESMLTGESMPQDKKVSSEVFGATININGAIQVKAMKVGEDTVLAQIVKMVSDAQAKKAPIQKLADKIAGVFVPIVLIIAVITALWWYLTTGSINQSIIPAVAVLVIACPCALGLATPTAIMVGTGQGAKRGILIKNGESLERGKDIKVMVFDKTGTLTSGKPKVTDIIPLAASMTETELLTIGASLEKLSEHPLAQAVVMAANKRNLSLKEIQSFENIAGKGVKGHLGGSMTLIGSIRFLINEGVDVKITHSILEKLEQEAKTVVGLAKDGQLLGILAIADTLKPEAKEAVEKLKNLKIEPVMISGDNQKTAAVIAEKVGIKKVLAEVLPAAKAQEVKKLQQQGNKVAFVGDGINDAPALVQADLGIAVGTGTDIAIEAGNIVLVKGNPLKSVEALKLAQFTLKTIKQNLFWAFFYNVIAIPLAALGLLNPMIAAGAMAFSSVSVVGNSLKIKRKNF